MTKRSLAAFVAMLMLAATMAVAGSASAQQTANPWFVDRYETDALSDIVTVRPNGRVEFTTPIGRVYGDASHDYFVLTSGDIQTFCFGDPPRATTMIGYRAGGEFVMKTPVGGAQVATSVYTRPDGADDIFEWAGSVCGAWEADGTPLPTPIATGYTAMRINSNPEIPFWSTGGEQPAGVFRNGLTGTLTDADGNLWDLSTRAVFEYDPSIPGPPDFIRHDVSLTPQGT